jgi:hypothetical protein
VSTSTHLVWSKNLCGVARVVFQELSEPFATLNQAFIRSVEVHDQLFGHARGRQGRGQRDGLIPERLGKALAGVRPRLAPVLKLRGSLVKLMLRVQRGLDLHVALHVIGFPS